VAKQVEWNKTAIRRLKHMVSYLEENTSLQAAENLTQRIFEKLKMLRRYPETGRKSKNRKTIRFVKIGKNRRMYYRIHGKKLIIVDFFDTRQHWDKNPY
jgi:addiction module RelE/StbE family toxin